MLIVENSAQVLSWQLKFHGLWTDKLTGQNMGRVFSFRSGYVHAAYFRCYQKLPNLKLKTRAQTTFSFSPVRSGAPQFK